MPLLLRFRKYNSRRNPNSRRTCRYIGKHHRHGSDLSTASNADITQHLRVCSEVHIILDHRRRTIRHTISDRHTMAKSAIPTNDCLRMNENIPEMIDPQSWSDSSLPTEGLFR